MEGAGQPGPEEAPATPPAKGEMHPLQSLGHGSLIALVGQVFTVGTVFGIRVLLVNYLGLTQWGLLSLGTALMTLLASVGALGLPQIVPRQLAHSGDPRERRTVARQALGITVVAALVSGVAVWLSAPWLSLAFGNPGFTEVLQLFALALALNIVAGTVASYFQGNEDVFPNTLFNQVLNPTLVLVFVAVVVVFNFGLLGALVAYILASAVTLGGLALYSLLPTVGRPWAKVGATLRGIKLGGPLTSTFLLSLALPLATLGIATAATGTVDTLVLGYFTNAVVVGQYSAVLPLARLVSLGVVSLGYIMLPVASRLHAVQDLPELRRSYTTITKWILLLALPFFAVFLLLPQASLAFVYGSGVYTNPAWAGAPLLLQITVVGTFLATLAGPAASVLVGLGRFRLLLYNTLASAVVDLCVSLALVPFLGAVGAAIAFAAASASLPLLSVAQTYLLEGVHPFQGVVVRPLLVALVPLAGAVLYLGSRGWTPGAHAYVELPLLAGAFLLAYLVALPLTRSLEVGDAHLLQVAEHYLGRRIPFVRRYGRRFVTEPG